MQQTQNTERKKENDIESRSKFISLPLEKWIVAYMLV